MEKYNFAENEINESLENISMINICQINNVESGLPKEEQTIEYLNKKNRVVIYDQALIQDEASPLFVGIPHAGELIPKEILPRIKDTRGFVGGLDCGTAMIFSPREGENYIAARDMVSRLVADPNRGPRQFQSGTQAVGGVTWKTNLQEQPIYKEGQEPTDEEMAENVDRYYTPYYRALHALAASLHEKMDYKEVLFLDAHSFPGNVDFPKYGLKAVEPKPLFILGNKDYSSASQQITLILQNALIKYMPHKETHPELYEGISDIVAINAPFKGVRNVEYFGYPEEITENISTNMEGENTTMPFKIHAIQLEINMSVFFNDGKYNLERLELVRSIIQKTIAEVGEELKKYQK